MPTPAIHRSVGAMGHEPSSLPPYADGMKGSYLGPHFPSEQIRAFLDDRKLPYRLVDRAELPTPSPPA